MFTLAVVLMSAASADAKGRNCARPNTVTLASTLTARVWRPGGGLSHRLYGCLKSLDRAYRLDHNSSASRPWTFGRVPRLDPAYPGTPGARRWTFSGRFAGLWARSSTGSESWVYDLRSGRMAVRLNQFSHSFRVGGVRYHGVRLGPLLATNGVPVWLNYIDEAGSPNGEVVACLDSGVSAWNRPCRIQAGPSLTGAVPPRIAGYIPVVVVSRGRRSGDGTPSGLRVSGTVARWTSGGAARSRDLAYLGA